MIVIGQRGRLPSNNNTDAELSVDTWIQVELRIITSTTGSKPVPGSGAGHTARMLSAEVWCQLITHSCFH